MLAIRLPVEIEDRLEVLANRTGRTKTFYAREAILRYLDEIEGIYLKDDVRNLKVKGQGEGTQDGS